MKTKENSLVSVVLITYNSSKYVLDTLESVKNQTWDNIELIISDDGSTDNTTAICSNWLSENQNRFYNALLITVDENTGIPSNCNRGLRATQGEWLKIIPGDDILLNNCISDNMDYSRRFPKASFIVSDIKEIDDNGNLIRDQIDNESLLFFSNITSAQKQLKSYSRWPAFINTPTFFFRSNMIEKIGYCDEEFKIYEDMTMVIRIMESNYKLHYLKKPTVAYRIHHNAISRNPKANEIREKEVLMVFNKYRKRHLSLLNPFDLSVYYENWLRFGYKGINGRKGISILKKLSLYYWYMRLNGIKSY